MVRIITDGTSDMSVQRGRELGVDVIPMRVFFDQECFLDGVDITREEFFARLASSQELPTTSQLSPDDFLGLFRKYTAQGDQVVGIFVSTELSGTCQSACIAREMVEDGEIYIVDSRTVTFAMALLVEEAAHMRDQGLSAARIAAEVEKLAHRTRLLAVVDTLTYLKKGGAHLSRHRRCGRAAGHQAHRGGGQPGHGGGPGQGPLHCLRPGLDCRGDQKGPGGSRSSGGLRPLQFP